MDVEELQLEKQLETEEASCLANCLQSSVDELTAVEVYLSESP
jgi:hypothetical protein